MSAPQEKHVVVAVKTVPLLSSSSAAAVSKAPVVKKVPLVVKSTSGTPSSGAPKPAQKALVSKPVSSGGVAELKRKTESSGAPVLKKPKVAVTSKPKVSVPHSAKTVQKKKIAGDDCTIEEERSDDGDDDGEDLKGFLVDDDDDEDGYSSEEEAKKVEARSFSSVDKYKMEMAKVKALLGSRETRNKFIQENPDIFKEEL